MRTNDANRRGKLVYPKLSYLITGVYFTVHNELGRFARERQYGDVLEERLKESNLTFHREVDIGNTGNRFDFLVGNKIVLEVKAKNAITKDDYHQLQRYLQRSDHKLGLLVNFRSRYLKPIRVIKIDTDVRHKFQ